MLTAATDLPGIKYVTDQYSTLFVPASYAFAVWGLIYLAHVIYCIVQLLPSQKYFAVYDKLNGTFIMVNLLSIAWLYSFRQNLIPFSEALIIAMLIGAIILFSIAYSEVKKHNQSRWITVPFAMLMGWLSVAIISGTSLFLVYIKWNAFGISPGNWTMILLAVTMLLSLIIGAGFREILYPLVIAWGCFALWMKLKHQLTMPAQVALIVAIVSLLIAVWSIIKQIQQNTKVPPENSL